MYNHFFGFKERPFKLVPNPDYLFLSKSHEEALAHLRYAVTDGEGFVEIIGEIGTGKTMLCRTFLESLSADTESAYIFNPRMDAVDLLKAINDEFSIPSDHHSTKALIDALNSFLIEKKAAGKNVILLIDEAQNLSKEVLEQIRLLSNLETTKDKLLQIILVGQPELGEMLDSYELRQLGQRISLSCRLHPLTYSETKQYIAHRIHVVSQKSAAVFSKSAIRRIYKFSRGIPRLINMACDRSLLTAYGRHRLKVSGPIAKSAILELATSGDINRNLLTGNAKRLFALSTLCVVLLVGLFFHSDIWHIISKAPSTDTPASVIEMETILPKASTLVQARKSLPETEKTSDDLSGELEQRPARDSRVIEPASEIKNDTQPIDFQQLLIYGGVIFSKNASFESLLQAWGMRENSPHDLDEISDDLAFFSLAAQQNGLVVTPIAGNLERIVQLNIPAILKFNHHSGVDPVYLTAIKVTPDTMIFSGDDSLSAIAVPYAWIMENWSGSGFVFWKNFYNYQGTIPVDAPGESVITLKLHLRDIGYQHIEISGTYDLATQMAIKAIQARHGIPIDGYVGPLTKIVLYNEKQSLAIPHLWEQMTIPDEVTGMGITQKAPERVLPNPEPPNN
ncbi:MAG: AAA family ATPase [Desulfobacteraceae bacterium]|nr:AAA family ATPase [Desulfobacteraceae bacterium]MBC2756257.1 AAA family ATPase [Desulfobacteraceae bacterium]